MKRLAPSYAGAMEMLRLESLRSVNGLPFGAPEPELLAVLGAPDARRTNYTGEIELLYGPAIYRCLDNRFVECTYPESRESRTLVVNGVPVVHVYDWLGTLADSIDRARFRISLATGIACDRRDPQALSYTLFAAGHWDGLFPEP